MAFVPPTNVGIIDTGASAVLASFDAVTADNVIAGEPVFLDVAGWSSDSTGGARLSGITDDQGNTWYEEAFERKTNGFTLAHTVSRWRVDAALSTGVLTATCVPLEPTAVSIWDGCIFSCSGLTATPLEQPVVTNDQAPTQTSMITGDITISVASAVLIASAMAIADSFGTITEDTGAGWTLIAESESAEGFGTAYRVVTPGTYAHTWALGFTSQYGP